MKPLQKFDLPANRRQPVAIGSSRALLRRSLFRFVCVVITGLLAILPGAACGEDRIILRNLKLISGRPISSFDIEGVHLADGDLITWDRIEKVTAESLDQEAISAMHNRLSKPLFRIRLRLKSGDDNQLLPLAEKMFPIYAGSRGELSRLVSAAKVRGLIAAGQREQAVVALLHFLARLPQERLGSRSADYRLSVDPQSKLCDALLPVWFDAGQAKEQLPELLKALAEVSDYPREFHVYTGSLALAAGDRESAQQAIAALDASDPMQADLKTLLQAQADIIDKRNDSASGRLSKLIVSQSPQIRALALYWSGIAQSTAADNRTRMRAALTLLRITAGYGRRFEGLSAAALYEASNAVDDETDPSQTRALRRELSQQFPDSWHGRLLSRMATADKK